jgi:hypothetical protein
MTTKDDIYTLLGATLRDGDEDALYILLEKIKKVTMTGTFGVQIVEGASIGCIGLTMLDGTRYKLTIEADM